jgi:hypothetical protein
MALLRVLPSLKFYDVRGRAGEQHDVRATASFPGKLVLKDEPPVSDARTFGDELSTFAPQYAKGIGRSD